MDKLLFQLKMHGAMTAAELSRRLGISAQATRERLDRVRKAGLVVHRDEVRGIGRPKRVWELSETARSRFPDTHAELTVSFIEAVRASLGETALERLIAHREEAIERRYGEAMAGCTTLVEKTARLAAERERDGYMAEWRTDDGGILLIENHCPICAAARACQGFCRSELDMFERLLGPDCTVERAEHTLAGARRCVYRITPRPAPRR
jgi:predicted ArsR family transcriptional regulator